MNNSEISENKKFKFMLYLPKRKDCTLTDGVILENLSLTLKSLDKSFWFRSSNGVLEMTLEPIWMSRKQNFFKSNSLC